MKEDCAAIRKWLDAYLDDELASGDRRKVERHLQECAACRQVLAEIGEIQAGLKDDAGRSEPGPEYFESLPQRFWERHRLEEAQRGWRPLPTRRRFTLPSFFPPRLVPALRLAFVVLVVVGVAATIHEIGHPPLRPVLNQHALEPESRAPQTMNLPMPAQPEEKKGLVMEEQQAPPSISPAKPQTAATGRIEQARRKAAEPSVSDRLDAREFAEAPAQAPPQAPMPAPAVTSSPGTPEVIREFREMTASMASGKAEGADVARDQAEKSTWGRLSVESQRHSVASPSKEDLAAAKGRSTAKDEAVAKSEAIGGTSPSASARSDSSGAFRAEANEVGQEWAPLLAREGDPSFPDHLWSESWRAAARARANAALQSMIQEDCEAALLAYWRMGHRGGRDLYPDPEDRMRAFEPERNRLEDLLHCASR